MLSCSIVTVPDAQGLMRQIGWSFCRVSFVGDQFWPILLKWIDLTIQRYPIDILFTTWNERNQKPSLGWFPLCLSSSMNLWHLWSVRPARKIGGSYRSKHLNPSLPLGDPGYVQNCGPTSQMAIHGGKIWWKTAMDEKSPPIAGECYCCSWLDCPILIPECNLECVHMCPEPFPMSIPLAKKPGLVFWSNQNTLW